MMCDHCKKSINIFDHDYIVECDDEAIYCSDTCFFLSDEQALYEDKFDEDDLEDIDDDDDYN